MGRRSEIRGQDAVFSLYADPRRHVGSWGDARDETGREDEDGRAGVVDREKFADDRNPIAAERVWVGPALRTDLYLTQKAYTSHYKRYDCETYEN
ncbi:hypothetical protein BHE74_00032785 [Ensete ventricosum]|nr:hypothetical protein GW17_00026323 [Ensete ventricosum]RWW60229.1 hypothetical protein BHE74_00032785 [Ensete ventricosum]